MIKYLVTINGSSALTTAPNDGFISDTRYNTLIPQGGATLAASLANARANIRFIAMRNQLNSGGLVWMENLVKVGETVLLAPSSLSFNCFGIDYTPDETTPGTTLLGATAIQRKVARALILSTTYNMDYYDPTPSLGNAPSIQVVGGVLTPGPNAQSVPRALYHFLPVTAGPIVAVTGVLATDLATAAALITVTVVS